LEASSSYIEKTAKKLLPILNELKKRMIPEKKCENFDDDLLDPPTLPGMRKKSTNMLSFDGN
jgi:hypothetical protein